MPSKCEHKNPFTKFVDNEEYLVCDCGWFKNKSKPLHASEARVDWENSLTINSTSYPKHSDWKNKVKEICSQIIFHSDYDERLAKKVIAKALSVAFEKGREAR